MLDSTANSNLISDYFNQGKTAAIISGPWDAKKYEGLWGQLWRFENSYFR